MSQPRSGQCQDAPSKIFAALCQKFPNIPAKLVTSIVFHDFAALDLYTLPLQFGNVKDRTTPFRCPGATYEQRCASAAVAWSQEPNLVFRHLCTYFSILSAYFIGQPDVPLVFFRYLDHLKHLSVVHEWTPVHRYHVEFFSHRVGEMRHGDFSKWAVPEASLLKKYGFDRESFLPEPHQYATNKILYNGKLWRLEKDPTRGQISFILRRTRDPFAAEIQYIAQIKLTTKHLDMCNLPIGKSGEKFHALDLDQPGDPCNDNHYNSNQIKEYLSYEGGDLPFLTVVSSSDHSQAWMVDQDAKHLAKKAQRRAQRIAHFKSLLPRALAFSLPRNVGQGA